MTVRAITLYQENLPTQNYFHVHNNTENENGTLKPNESIAVVEIGRKSTTVGNGHQLIRGDPTTVVYATSLPTPTSPAPTSKPKGKVDGKIINSSSEQHIVKVNADPKQENVPSYVFYSNVRKQQPQPQPIEQKPPPRNNSIFAYLAEKRRNQQTVKGNSRPTGLVMTRPSQNPRYRNVENVLPINHKADKYQSTEHQPEVIDPNEQRISSQSQLPPPPYLHHHTASAFMRPPIPPPLPPYPMRNNFPIHPMTVTDFEKILNLLTIRYLLKRKIFDYRRMYEPHSPYEPPYYQNQQRHNPYLPLGSERFEQHQQQQQLNQQPESENQPIGYNEAPYRRNSALPPDVREQLLYRLLMLTLESDPVVGFEQSANMPQNHNPNPNYDYYSSFPLPHSAQNNPLPPSGPEAGPGQPNNNIYYAASSSNNHNTNHYGNGNKPVRSVQILGEEAR